MTKYEELISKGATLIEDMRMAQENAKLSYFDVYGYLNRLSEFDQTIVAYKQTNILSDKDLIIAYTQSKVGHVYLGTLMELKKINEEFSNVQERWKDKG